MRKLWWLLPLLTGCKVTDAPEDLEQLMVFGFENFDRDPEFLASMGVNLFPLVDVQFEDISDGYRIENLTAEQLEAAGIDDPNVDSILGAMGAADYTHSIDDILPGMLAYNRSELFDQIKEYEVTDEEGDRDCFFAGECDTYTLTATQTVNVALLGDSTQTFTATWRWIDGEDGERFVVSRTLCPNGVEFNSDIMVVHQQYGLAVIYPNGDFPRRVESFWVDADIIGADVPDYFAVDSAAGAMKTQAERIDDWLDEGGEGAE